MQIDNRIVSPAAGDGLGNLAGRAASTMVSVNPEVAAAPSFAPGGYDPSSRISLSVDALLYLSRNKRTQEKYPPLTKAEWSNILSPQLAAREYQAFGKFSETGDDKAYYRAFMDYYDNLRAEDQNSLRYFGTRDAAVTGLRTAEYSSQSGDEPSSFQTLVSVLLAEDKPVAEAAQSTEQAGMITGDMFGWDTGTISDEDAAQTGSTLTEIEKFYIDGF